MSKKLLGVGVALTLVLSVAGVSAAKAQTVSCSNIDAMLTALGVTDAAKVAQAKVAFGCSSTATASFTFTKNLTVGSTGADVTALQTKLGVSPATGYFGAITKAAVMAYQAANGLPSTGYVGPLTLAKLNYVAPATTTTTTTTTSNTVLEGGAGDIDLSNTSTGVKTSLKEGESNVKVLGFKAEASGSDIAVTNVKVTLKNASSTDGTSEKLSSYLENVAIYMGSTKVGSADVADFTKTSDTPDYFTKTIALSNAVVKEDADAKFYVAVSANSSIDSDNIGADLKVELDTVRYTDATGAVLTASDVSDVSVKTFSFEDASTDDSIEIKSSSSNPDDQTVTVDETKTSDTFTDLAFKLYVGSDSSDVDVTSIPVTLTVAGAGASADSVEDIVDSVVVNVDGTDYDADLTTDSVENGSGTAVYTVDLDTGDYTIGAGDTSNVKVKLAFKEQKDNYDENTTVTASVNPANIDAETADDEITVDGSTKTGAELTLNLAAATVSGYRWSVNTTGTIVDFYFTVENDGDEVFDVLSADIASSTDGTATTSAGALSKTTGDASVISGGYSVDSGDTATFRVRYNISGASNGLWSEVTITSVAGNVIPDDKQTSPTATLNVSN